MLEFRILGPFTVVRDGRAVAIGGARRRAFLALLAVNAGRVVSTARIADEIWNGAPPRTASHGLEVHASELRKVLGKDVLSTRPPGYVLAVYDDSVDATRFHALVGQAHEALSGGRAAAAVRLLAEAERLWRGDVLADIADTGFARHEARRLDEIHLTARELAAEAEIALGVLPATIARLREAASAHPYREHAQALLVRALAVSGRRADALAAYANARRRLVDDLGIEPGPELRAAQAIVLRPDAEPDRLANAPARPGSVVAVARSARAVALPASVADAIAAASRRDLVAAGAIPRAGQGPSDVASVSAACAGLRAGWRTRSRTAAFTTQDPAAEIAEFAHEQEAELLVVRLDEWPLGDGPPPARTRRLLDAAGMDVALVHGTAPDVRDDGVAVPFGGNTHDWAAAEIGAHLARASAVPVRVIGIGCGGEDASRMLAHVALALQRSFAVDAEPVLAGRGADRIADAAGGCRALVMGLSERWAVDGLGRTRMALVEAVPTAIVLHRGACSGVLGGADLRHRLAWSTPARDVAVPVG